MSWKIKINQVSFFYSWIGKNLIEESIEQTANYSKYEQKSDFPNFSHFRDLFCQKSYLYQ